VAIGVGFRLLSLGLRCSLLLLEARVCFGLVRCRGRSWRRFGILSFGGLVLGWLCASLFWVRLYTLDERGRERFIPVSSVQISWRAAVVSLESGFVRLPIMLVSMN
jgi:hypothetical protein